ncbi:magnesium/cobalt transporter CorA [Halomonas sp. McH1-25]|uniref:magnesium/cobalt transporter CorA n=1 Tax=unclassified Halomonas TaxID=2609666 RepID=UPI001EF534C9|nr:MULTISPECIES: magnesium/cobalt transporter CorA [unclassified Halomonas]MCG7599271.1 magnesium/cobalt transporter CorA [Halomonas sp. McH1-25]MCP1341139.1 magnesium/cobalt transporter CorA [Halomonas sp. FL8]MCP1360267.1 magnesium/cobalt transporter CorA [Halomonas sp. BBD45]MCP1367552.1 magnesium/cobalt transporter CorA [Halomonas sp. BBD48]
MIRTFTLDRYTIKEDNRETLTLPQRLSTATWIDAHEPDEDEREHLNAFLADELPAGEDVEEIESSARYFVDADGIHVHSLFLSHSEGRHGNTTVAFILQPDRLITFRDCELADFRLLRMRARYGQVEADSPQALTLTIFDQKVENLADTLEDIHRRLEDVSHLVLEEEGSDLEEAIDQLAKLEDSNGKIRLCLMDTQRSVAFLMRQLRGHSDLQELAREVMRDVETLMTHTTFLFDKINFLMDSTQGFINIQQNQIIKIFSIAAVVFLPPTLVASIYGMNFEHMPELSWPYGYPFALLLMVAAGVSPYLYFKHKNWL